jgi:hypothetical protein
MTASYTPEETFTMTVTPSITVTSTRTATVTPSATVTATDTRTPTATATEMPCFFEAVGTFPNPFDLGTRFVYRAGGQSRIGIKIFTVSGETVLEKDGLPAATGYNTWIWDGKNSAGNEMSSGVFICRLRSYCGNEKFEVLRKVVIVR